MKRSILVVALGATMLGGCNLAPHYVRPAVAAPATLPQGGVYPAAAAGTVAAADLAWKDFFTDPALRQVIAMGLENNRDLRVAVANIAQARAQYGVQRADRVPSLSASGSATYQRSANGFQTSPTRDRESHVFSGQVGISSFELDFFGRVRNLSEAALQTYLATAEAQRTTRISLISEIATAYATLAADQDQLRISTETYAAYEKTVALTKAQFERGVTSELEVKQAQANYDQARYNIATARTQIAQDQNALNLLVGTTVPAALLPQGMADRQFTLTELPAGVSSDVLLRRPDVLQAEHQLMAQNANIGAARAAFFPRISLTGALGVMSGGLSRLFDSGTDMWSAAPSVSLPLFDGGRNRGNLDYAKAGRDAAVATYEKAVQTAFREVADALATRGTIDEQVASRTTRAAAARAAYTIADARYRAGVDNFLTALDSQRTAYSADQDLVTTRLARVNNLITLYRTLGGGLS